MDEESNNDVDTSAKIDGDTNTMMAIVIDNGSATIKAGWAGADKPQAVFPSVVGRSKSEEILPNSKSEITELTIGEEALSKRAKLNLRYPIEWGTIADWEDTERLWHHAFDVELNVSPQEHHVLITEPPLTPKVNREKMTEVMFETFDVPGLYIANQAELIMYTHILDTGVNVDLGDGLTLIVPVNQRCVAPNTIVKSTISGWDITHKLQNMLSKRDTVLSKDIVRVKDIKHKVCYVAQDFEAEQQKDVQDVRTLYKLPNGETCDIEKERFLAPEAYFQPSLLELEQPGLAKSIYSTIMRVDADVRKDMFSNILLSGGSSLIPGLGTRLQKELQKLVNEEFEVNVRENFSEYATWVGGSIRASLPSMDQAWMTKAEYHEAGVFADEEEFF